MKKRNWAFVLYPESAPFDWKDILQRTGLSVAVSPLHDKDLNPDGEPKKAHYHVIVCYSGPTSFNVVKSLCDSLSCPIPQPLEQVRGYYRYFTHKDNPEKYQYDESDIFSINGFNISDYVELTKSEVSEIKLRIVELIRNLDFLEYSDLMEYLIDNELKTEFDIASNNTLFFDRFLTSRRCRAEKIVKKNAEESTAT